jgi:hypothetical protein
MLNWINELFYMQIESRHIEIIDRLIIWWNLVEVGLSWALDKCHASYHFSLPCIVIVICKCNGMSCL